MAVTRVKLTNMDVDAAIRKTLENGFCRNPDLIPDEILRKIRERLNGKLEQTGLQSVIPARKSKG